MMEQAFRDLHRAALAMATHLMATGDDDKLIDVEAGLNGGGKLIIEIGPLPDPQRVQIVLVEPEGRRQVVCGISVRMEAMQ
jgi:hypothetical protein